MCFQRLFFQWLKVKKTYVKDSFCEIAELDLTLCCIIGIFNWLVLQFGQQFWRKLTQKQHTVVLNYDPASLLPFSLWIYFWKLTWQKLILPYHLISPFLHLRPLDLFDFWKVTNVFLILHCFVWTCSQVTDCFCLDPCLFRLFTKGDNWKMTLS